MGGLAESNAGYSGVAAMMASASAANVTPANPPVVTDTNRCTNSRYECNAMRDKVKATETALDREKANVHDDRERLVALEAVLARGEASGEYDLSQQRIKKMQEIDVVQRNDVYHLEKLLAEANKALADYLSGNAESKALGKLNRIAVVMGQIPHAPMCKVEAGLACACHHKAINAILSE